MKFPALSFLLLCAFAAGTLFGQEADAPDPEEPTAVESDAEGYELRTWTDSTNGKKARARFVSIEKGKVTLEGETGKRFSIDMKKLGSADRAYLRNKKIEFVERTQADKTAAESRIAASGGVVSLYGPKVQLPGPGFSFRYRSPFTAARSVAYGKTGNEILVWHHSNEALVWDNSTGRKLKAFKGNTSGSEVVAFTGDGRMNVSVGENDTVVLKDTLTGETLKTLTGHKGFVTAVAINHEGTLALSGSADRTAILWDTEKGTPLHVLEGHEGRVLSVAFHPVGGNLLTGDENGTAIFWNAKSGKKGRVFSKIKGPLNSVSFSQGGEVAMLIAPGTATLWDSYIQPVQPGSSSSGNRKNPVLGEESSLGLVVPNDPIVRDGLFESVSFSRNNEFVLLVSKIGNAYFGNLKTRQWVRRIEKVESGINRAAFNHDASEYLTVSFNDNAVFWDNATGEAIDEFEGFNYCVSPIRMTRDGGHILTSGGWADPTIAVWETTTGKLLKRLEGHESAVRHIEVLPDGKRVLSVSFEKFDDRRHDFLPTRNRDRQNPRRHVILWDVSTGETLVNVKNAVGWALSPNGKTFLTGTVEKAGKNEANKITFWDTHTGRVQREADLKTGNLGHDFLFYPDGGRLLAKRGNAAFSWVARSGVENAPLQDLTYDVWSTVFSPNGRFLLSGTAEGKAEYWNLLRGEQEFEFDGHGGGVLCVAISPDGLHALTGSTDKTAILWSTETGEQVRRLTAGDGSVVGVDFTKDGKLIMVATEDGTVRFHPM